MMIKLLGKSCEHSASSLHFAVRVRGRVVPSAAVREDFIATLVIVM